MSIHSEPQPTFNKETKERFMTIRTPLSVQNQLKAVAEANTRTVSGQALLYIKQGIAQDLQANNGTSTKTPL